MPLTNKFLRYSPEITLEIFTLVYNKLIENKWSSINVKTLYDQFVGNWNYIVDDNHGKQFYTSTTNRELKETTVQEILGYDPFVKKAFDAQNNQKSIEKWSVGSYVVAINDGHARGKPEDKYKIGFIDEIDTTFSDSTIGIKFSSNCCDKSDFKWFATKSEAEEFAKTLVEPVKHGNGILDAAQVKQPSKQAVHCKTQEQWDFVLSKIDYKQPKDSFRPGCNSVVTVDEEDKSNIGCVGSDFLFKNIYQLLSFQEWCDLNGYKMEKEVKFKVGRWYKNPNWGNPDKDFIKYSYISGNYICGSERIRHEKHLYESTEWGAKNQCTLASIEEIQQYLPDSHIDLIVP